MANGRADTLSRRPDYDQGVEDNNNVTVLPEHLLQESQQPSSHNTVKTKNILKAWIDPHQLKQLNRHLVQRRMNGVTKELQGKCKIIKAHHDPPVHGHPGINRTTQIHRAQLLVASTMSRHQGLCTRMCRLPMTQSQQPTNQGTFKAYISQT
jgi:hypothetical protein